VQTDALPLSYADTPGLIHTTAKYPRDAAVEPGDQILIIMPGSAERIECGLNNWRGYWNQQGSGAWMSGVVPGLCEVAVLIGG